MHRIFKRIFKSMKITVLRIFKSSNILLLSLRLVGQNVWPFRLQYYRPLTIDHRWWSSWMNHKFHIIISVRAQIAGRTMKKIPFHLVFSIFSAFLIIFNIRSLWVREGKILNGQLNIRSNDIHWPNRSLESLWRDSSESSFRFGSDFEADRLDIVGECEDFRSLSADPYKCTRASKSFLCTQTIQIKTRNSECRTAWRPSVEERKASAMKSMPYGPYASISLFLHNRANLRKIGLV